MVVGLSLGILARRYAGVVARGGRIVALPFLAILVTPVPVLPGAHSTRDLFLWSPVGGLVALAWTVLVTRVVGGQAPPVVPATRRPSRRRVDVPTRMALQMLVGLGGA